MDPAVKNALSAICTERDRLAKLPYVAHQAALNTTSLSLPKRNLKLKMAKLWASPNRFAMILKFSTNLMRRMKYFHFLRLLFTYPAEINRLQKRFDDLELQLIDHRIKLLQLSKFIKKNGIK